MPSFSTTFSLYSPLLFFFLNDTAPPEIYSLSLHDALPISARTALAAAFDRRQDLGAEAMLAAEFCEQRDVARLAMTEAEVRADFDHGGAELLRDDLAHELERRQTGKLAREGQDHEQVDSLLFDQPDLALERREQLRGPFRREEPRRVRFKRDRGRHHSRLPRRLDDAPEQPLVSKVDAVKIADGHHARSAQRLKFVEGSDDAHRLKKSSVISSALKISVRQRRRVRA